jgi:hypothetical protein
VELQVHQEQVDLQQLTTIQILLLLQRQEQLEQFKVTQVLDIMDQH